MKLSKEERIKHAIVLDRQSLEFLNEFLIKEYKFVYYQGKCNDDTTIEFSSLEELINYENPHFKKLDSLRISSSNREDDYMKFSFLAEFVIDFGTYSTPIKYQLRSENYKTAIAFEKELRDRIKEFKPWYSILSTMDYINLLLILLGVILGLFLITGSVLFLSGYLESESNSNPPSWGLNLAITFIGLIFLIGYLLNLFVRYFFPKVVINIGKQEASFLKKKKQLNFVFIVLLLGLTLSIIGNLLTSLILN